MKKYRLLKDLPQCPAGTIFEFQKCDRTLRLYDCYHAWGITFDYQIVEHNPDWFEEVKEKEFTKQDLINYAGYLMHEYQSQHGIGNELRPASEFEKWLRDENLGKDILSSPETLFDKLVL